MSRQSRRFALTHLLDDDTIGLEARAVRDEHLALKLWLRLLACSTQVEIEVRSRLRERFDMSLARFDYLAQLHRHPDGLRMSTLSRYLMVTGGNVTALTDELARDGLVVREPDADDRRSVRLRMTPAGRKAFERIAREHEQWVIELFAGLDAGHKQSLYELLGRLRVQMAAARAQPTGIPR
jgi:DNA-binding MarR family transcriptional regulator